MKVGVQYFFNECDRIMTLNNHFTTVGFLSVLVNFQRKWKRHFRVMKDIRLKRKVLRVMGSLYLNNRLKLNIIYAQYKIDIFPKF